MIRRLAITMALMTLWSSSHAEFVILDSSALPPQLQTPVEPVLPAPVEAKPPVAPAKPKDSAFSSLKDTLKKIVPPDWKAYSDKTLPANTPVEYSPSADWRSSLAALANRYNLVFKVDPEAKTIYIDHGPGGMRDLQADMRNLASDSLAMDKTPAVVTEDGRLRFEVRDGQRLSEAVRTFMKAGDWEVTWEAGSDFQIERGFVVIESDLANLLTKALHPFNLNATLHKGNNVAVIRSNAVTE